jgi:hypothetical protein
MSLKSAKVGFIHEVSLKDILVEIDLYNFSHKDIISFIKKLDVNMEDWDATEELYLYFEKLHKENMEENPNSFKDGKYQNGA